MNQKDIQLFAGHATPKNIILRALPVAAAVATTTIFLYAGHATPNNVILSDPTVVIETGGGGFPTQYSGFKIRKTGSTIELCLVAEADAATGMGGVPKIRKGGVTYALYLVETADGNASPVRIRTSIGTKSIRVKT